MVAAQGWTNRGAWLLLKAMCNAEAFPTTLSIALVTDAVAPTSDTNIFSDLTEIADGNGYTTGGYELTRDSTDFPTATETDASDFAIISIKDVVWSASGGSIPDSGDGARYAVLIDDNATVADRQVWHWWDLTSARTVSNGQDFTLSGATISLYTAGTVT